MIIRHEDIKPGYIKALVISLLAAHTVCWGACYTISSSNRTMVYPNLFLSRAMDADPSRAIACILFPIIAILTGLILLFRSVLLSPRVVTPTQLNLWRGFNICGVAISLGMIVVPAVPYSLHEMIHLMAAYTVFLSGFTVMFISWSLDHSLKLPVVLWMKNFRLSLTVCGLAGSIGFVVFFNLDYFLSSLFEFIAASAMTGYICTLSHESDLFGDRETKPDVKAHTEGEQVTLA
jgi:hypothetical protein